MTEEITDAEMETNSKASQNEEFGVDTLEKYRIRIVRQRKEYFELLEAANNRAHDTEMIMSQLESEREWTKALSADVGQLIKQNDELRDGIQAIHADRERIVARMMAVVGLQTAPDKIIDLQQNPATGTWEKPS